MSMITDRILQSTITRIEALPESYPKTMQALEPSICALLRFSNNHPYLSAGLRGIAVSTTIVVQNLLLLICLSQIIPLTPVIGVASIATCLVIDLVFIQLIDSIFSQIAKRQLDQTPITKMTAEFFNLDPEFVSALNTWTNETPQLNENWRALRGKIIHFYRYANYHEKFSLKNCQVHSLPDIFDIPVFRKLQTIDLSKNQLTTLPASIKNLQSLENLNLQENATLSSFPEEVLSLPQICTVDIANCNFSRDILENLREITSKLGYIGPRIIFSRLYRKLPSGDLDISTISDERLKRLEAIRITLLPTADPNDFYRGACNSLIEAKLEKNRYY